MGKEKKDKKKKGKGAEKTAEKTEKKLKLKAKKELAAKGEDDIESMVKAIEEEERKRQEVKEVAVGAPSHRSSFSITAHPDNPEIIFFGGEFYNGQKTTMFNDLLIYNLKRGEWSSIRSPAGPPPRSSHQVSIYHVHIAQCVAKLLYSGGGGVSKWGSTLGVWRRVHQSNRVSVLPLQGPLVFSLLFSPVGEGCCIWGAFCAKRPSYGCHKVR